MQLHHSLRDCRLVRAACCACRLALCWQCVLSMNSRLSSTTSSAAISTELALSDCFTAADCKCAQSGHILRSPSPLSTANAHSHAKSSGVAHRCRLQTHLAMPDSPAISTSALHADIRARRFKQSLLAGALAQDKLLIKRPCCHAQAQNPYMRRHLSKQASDWAQQAMIRSLQQHQADQTPKPSLTAHLCICRRNSHQQKQ